MVTWVKKYRLAFFHKMVNMCKTEFGSELFKLDNDRAFVFDLDGVLRSYDKDKRPLLYVKLFLKQIQRYGDLFLITRSSKDSCDQFLESTGTQSCFKMVRACSKRNLGEAMLKQLGKYRISYFFDDDLNNKGVVSLQCDVRSIKIKFVLVDRFGKRKPWRKKYNGKISISGLWQVPTNYEEFMLLSLCRNLIITLQY